MKMNVWIELQLVRAMRGEIASLLDDLRAGNWTQRRKPFLLSHDLRDRLTDLAPAREVPFIRKSGALFRLDGVDPAGVTVKHDALVVLFFD